MVCCKQEGITYGFTGMRESGKNYNNEISFAVLGLSDTVNELAFLIGYVLTRQVQIRAMGDQNIEHPEKILKALL